MTHINVRARLVISIPLIRMTHHKVQEALFLLRILQDKLLIPSEHMGSFTLKPHLAPSPSMLPHSLVALLSYSADARNLPRYLKMLHRIKNGRVVHAIHSCKRNKPDSGAAIVGLEGGCRGADNRLPSRSSGRIRDNRWAKLDEA